MDEGRLRRGHCLVLLHCGSLSVLTLMVVLQEGHPAHKTAVPLIPRDTVVKPGVGGGPG